MKKQILGFLSLVAVLATSASNTTFAADPVFKANTDKIYQGLLRALQKPDQRDELQIRLGRMNGKTLLQAAKRAQLDLRTTLKGKTERVDERLSGTIQGTGQSSGSFFSPLILGFGNSSGRFDINGKFTEKLNTEVYVIEIAKDVEKYQALVHQREALSQEILSDRSWGNEISETAEILAPQIQKLSTYAGANKVFFEEIVPSQNLLSAILDQMESRMRSQELTAQEEGEYQQVLQWARSTKIIASIQTLAFEVDGFKEVQLYDRKELIPWYLRGHRGEYIPAKKVAGYYKNSNGVPHFYAGWLSFSTANPGESELFSNEGVTGIAGKYLKGEKLVTAKQFEAQGLKSDREIYEVLSGWDSQGKRRENGAILSREVFSYLY